MRNLIREPTITNSGNTYTLCDRTIVCAKTFTLWACNEGDGARKGSAQPEESFWTFLEVAIRSMVCGPNAHSTKGQDEGLNMQCRSEGMQEGESGGLS